MYVHDLILVCGSDSNEWVFATHYDLKAIRWVYKVSFIPYLFMYGSHGINVVLCNRMIG